MKQYTRRENRIRKSFLAAMTLFLLVFLTGCASNEENTQSYKIYFLSDDRTSLSALDYELSEEGGVEDQIEEVLAILASEPKEDGLSSPIEGFDILGTSLSGNALSVNVSNEYEDLDGIEEILVRASIVCSLCSIDGVDSVSFLCDGEELTTKNEETVGAMTAQMFILSSGDEIDSYEKAQLHLYFANESGDRLVDTYRTVVYNANISLERLVVEEVLKGPNSDVVYPTLNEAAQILSVTTRDGVCYINFDKNFLEEPYKVASEVAIYSLVNSLTELTSVQEVQILIDGETDRDFMDMSLSSSFERNLSLVQEADDSLVSE